MRIIQKAQELIYKYNTNDPFTIAHQEGIIIYDVEFSEVIKGISVTVNEKKYILINDAIQCPAARKKLCAHQLGHHLLHPNQRTFYECHMDMVFPDLYEMEADRFASQLLAGMEVELIG